MEDLKSLTSASIHYGCLYDWFTQQCGTVWRRKVSCGDHKKVNDFLCNFSTFSIPFFFVAKGVQRQFFFLFFKVIIDKKKRANRFEQITRKKMCKNIEQLAEKKSKEKKSKGQEKKLQSSFKCSLQFHTYFGFKCSSLFRMTFFTMWMCESFQ